MQRPLCNGGGCPGTPAKWESVCRDRRAMGVVVQGPCAIGAGVQGPPCDGSGCAGTPVRWGQLCRTPVQWELVCRDHRAMGAHVQGPPCDGGGCAGPRHTAVARTELFFSAAALGSAAKRPVSDTTGVFWLLLSGLKATSVFPRWLPRCAGPPPAVGAGVRGPPRSSTWGCYRRSWNNCAFLSKESFHRSSSVPAAEGAD